MSIDLSKVLFKDLIDYILSDEKCHDISELDLYKLSQKDNLERYERFYIKKKNGNYREILAPCEKLKTIQKIILSLFYERQKIADKGVLQSTFSFGFEKNRTHIDNAKQHLNQKVIINLDIQDFFPSITYDKVFNAVYNIIYASKITEKETRLYPKYILENKSVISGNFNENRKIISFISNICTFNNQLPVGAPTSPFISNVVLFPIDEEINYFLKMGFKEIIPSKNKLAALRLRKFTKDTFLINYWNIELKYTRYIDDITISSKVFLDKNKLKYIKNGIKYILDRRGFSIQTKKTRTMSSGRRNKNVTGVIVSDRINAPRKFRTTVRAMLHNWEKFGIEIASQKFIEKEKLDNDFLKVLKGRIDYLIQIDNKSGSKYGSLYLSKYNKLTLRLIKRGTNNF